MGEYVIPQGEANVCGENSNGFYEKSQFVESLEVLDPDDPLMKRFQNALNDHLIKINTRLTEEYNELTIANKQADQTRLQKGNVLYEAQLDITNQVTLIEKWRRSLETIKCRREDEKNNFKDVRQNYYIVQHDVNRQHQMAESMSHDIESKLSLCRRLTEYESEVLNHLTTAKRMSAKDASVQRELIREKQQMDFMMLRACETMWKLEKESDILCRQIQLKIDEKLTISQTAVDVDTDLGVLEREQKKLINSWNRVIFSIHQRDKVYDELSSQRVNARESIKNLHIHIEKIETDTMKTMEYNEQLTEIEWRLNDELLSNEEAISVHKDRYQVVKYKTDSLMKLMEQTEAHIAAIIFEHQRLFNEENTLVRELERLMTQRNILEDEMMTKLEDKMTQNRTLKRFNTLLSNTRETLKQLELSMLQIENHCGEYLLEVKKLNNDISNEDVKLMEFDNINNRKNNEVNELHTEIEKCNSSIERKQKKIGKLIGKMNDRNDNMCGNVTNMTAPQAIKIASLEKDIEMLEVNNKENQCHWLRHEAVIVHLTDEQNSKIQNVSRLSKQIIIIQQKNAKLECVLGEEHKTVQNIERRMNELHQRLINTNTLLAERENMRNQLQGKNSIAKDECMKTLQHNEQEFFMRQNKIEEAINERCILTEKLRDENLNNFSWDNKLKFALETAKTIKLEQNPGGDVAIMRNEIRRMEIRLLYLQKVQDKMIRDMEYSITRREIIVDTALTKQIKNPKLIHNKQIMFQKRFDGRKLEIKQIKKGIKSIENETLNVRKQCEILQCKDKESEKLLECYQREITVLDERIAECENMKHHKLECLVRKQQKIKLFQGVRDGKYRTICQSITTLNDELNNQKTLNTDLINIMEQTNQDFPLFKDDVRQILLTLQQIN